MRWLLALSLACAVLLSGCDHGVRLERIGPREGPYRSQVLEVTAGDWRWYVHVRGEWWREWHRLAP